VASGLGDLRTVVISVGNELLFGSTVDTNSAWLGRELGALGLPVSRRYTVGDDADEIRVAVTEGMRCSELVLVTGGLGPTHDDITRGTVAELLGLPLKVDPGRLLQLEERFRRRGFDVLPEPNLSQAEIPEGARVLENPVGTAPGLAMESDGVLLVLLPGVPREMRAIFDGDLIALLRERFFSRLAPVVHRVLHTTGVPESRLAEVIQAAFPHPATYLGDGVSLAVLPDLRGVDLRLTVARASADEAESALNRAVSVLAPLVAPWRFEAESGDLAEAVLVALRRARNTLAVAESCTAGIVSTRLTEHAGSSDVFAGGVVAYSNEVKQALLGVTTDALESHGAVSEAVAQQMALGVRNAVGADVGVAITGIAGPGGGSQEKPIGTVWFAVSTPSGLRTECTLFTGDREAVRERAAQAALALVLASVGDPSSGH